MAPANNSHSPSANSRSLVASPKGQHHARGSLYITEGVVSVAGPCDRATRHGRANRPCRHLCAHPFPFQAQRGWWRIEQGFVSLLSVPESRLQTGFGSGTRPLAARNGAPSGGPRLDIDEVSRHHFFPRARRNPRAIVPTRPHLVAPCAPVQKTATPMLSAPPSIALSTRPWRANSDLGR